MKKTRIVDSETANKFISFILSFSLVVSLTPFFSFESIAGSQERETNSEVSEEKIDGRVLDSSEIDARFEGGSRLSFIDRSNINYNVSEEESEDGGATLNSTLPTEVDLRKSGKVSSVKDQSSTGTCWAWAVNAAAETDIATQTSASPIDLSAYQTSYFAYTKLSTNKNELLGTEKSQAGEGVQADAIYKSNLLNFGGNDIMPATEFMQGCGVTSARNIPFPQSALSSGSINSSNYLSSSQRRQTLARLKRWNYLGSLINTEQSGPITNYVSTNTTVLNRMKAQLASGHAISIGYHASNDYINRSTMAQYTYEYQQSNHGVCVVGYNDSYEKENFLAGHQPDKDGAFIVKNSWGSSWGDGGYFYLSYYDKSIDEATTFEFDTTSESGYTGSNIDVNKEVVDQYDYLQAQGTVAADSKSQLWYSNIYTATYRQRLHHVGVYVNADDSTVYYKVYKLNSGATSPKDVSGSISSPVASGEEKVDFKGYASIKLNSSVVLNKGEKYAIWISQKSSSKDADTYYAPRAICFKQYTFPLYKISFSSNAVVGSNESFYSTNPNSSWERLEDNTTTIDGEKFSADNYCVKGYSTVLDGSSNVQKINISRFCNKFTSEHFYTKDSKEAAALKKQTKNWTYEGTAWSSPTSSKTIVYRFSNKYTGEHFFTLDAKEVATLKKTKGMVFENIAWYASDSKTNVPIYRFLNKVTTEHFFTSDANEMKALKKNKYFKYEGIAWYGLS